MNRVFNNRVVSVQKKTAILTPSQASEWLLAEYGLIDSLNVTPDVTFTLKLAALQEELRLQGLSYADYRDSTIKQGILRAEELRSRGELVNGRRPDKLKK